MLRGCNKNVLRDYARVVCKRNFGPVRRCVRLGPRASSLLFFPSLQRKISIVASSIRQLQLSPSKYSRSLGATAMFSTAGDVKKEPVAQGPPVEEDILHINDPMIESNSSPPERFAKQGDSATSKEGDIWPHSVDPDSDMTQQDTRTHVVNFREELGTSSRGRFLRVKSGNRLLRHNLEKPDHEGRLPLVREELRIHRTLSGSLESSSPKRQHSFRDDVGHAASETFLLTRLTFSLLRYLGVGYRWVTKLLALGLYAIFLMPGFVKVGYKYFFSKNVHRSIVYGEQPRNRLDLYLPENADGPLPVFIFVTGGAWIIGYKAWGSLLGLQLLERDIIVCCVDYRNFPQGGISDMVEDVSTGIGFVVNHIHQYGGDPDRIYLGGQSAGSHLAACSIVEQARMEIGRKDGVMTWRPAQLKAFVGISGGYHLPKLVDHFHKRGLYKRLFLSIMDGETSLPMYSPELAVQSEAFAFAVPLLPPIYLFHGTADYSIPCDASTNFGRALEKAGATVFVKLYPDKTHTDVFIQDPMRGGFDALFDDLLAVVHADDPEARARDREAPLRTRLVPEILLKLARYVSPF